MHHVKSRTLFSKLSTKQQVNKNENLFELQMCQSLILLILQSLKLFFKDSNVVETINLKTKTKKHINKFFICCIVMEVTTTMNSINNNGGREDLCWFLFFQLFSLDTEQKMKKKIEFKMECFHFVEISLSSWRKKCSL